MGEVYHEGQRRLQDRFESRRIADRLAEITLRTAFTDDDKTFIESAPFFFLATADARGRPDCSFKGGMPGFVRITGASELAFPDYDGNGMFRSLGNIASNGEVGLLFIAMGMAPKRLRVNGRATIADGDPLLQNFPGRNCWCASPRARSFRIARATSRRRTGRHPIARVPATSRRSRHGKGSTSSGLRPPRQKTPR